MCLDFLIPARYDVENGAALLIESLSTLSGSGAVSNNDHNRPCPSVGTYNASKVLAAGCFSSKWLLPWRQSPVIPPVLPDPMVWVDPAWLVATMAVFSRPIGNSWRQSKFSYPRNVVAEKLGGFTLWTTGGHFHRQLFGGTADGVSFSCSYVCCGCLVPIQSPN